ncbi:MAG: ATP-binding cassette domain-containing protein [Deltaproteobacteria bacterium]|nr:ATP-binding cassette domain-containing protein [Deltaproteobacteria bacterium]
MAQVAFESVTKRYPGGAVGLADLTLTVADGELLVVVGPSGCGKSTLLRLLAGLEAPSAGTIRIGDRAVNELSPQERNVAMVFQDYALYPHLTVRGNLEFPLRMRGLPAEAVRRRAEEVAALLEIAPLLERRPRQLSGGQRQRVAMGRALVREPSVFLLDEPLSNLDARLRGSVRAEIGELQRRTRTTMLYVTHDQVEAMTLGQRVAVLDRGRLQQVAAPAELYERPVSAFVAGFIGNPPMSLFPTRAERDAAGRVAIAIGDQRVPVPEAHAAHALLAAQPDAVQGAGLRPEALGPAAPGAPALEATVDYLENLGREVLAYVLAPNRAGEPLRLVARLPGLVGLAPGTRIRLAVDGARLHLFDPAGRALR